MFTRLTKLYPTHACREHNRVFPLLVDNCGYRADNIPQLQDISAFLKVWIRRERMVQVIHVSRLIAPVGLHGIPPTTGGGTAVVA